MYFVHCALFCSLYYVHCLLHCTSLSAALLLGRRHVPHYLPLGLENTGLGGEEWSDVYRVGYCGWYCEVYCVVYGDIYSLAYSEGHCAVNSEWYSEVYSVFNCETLMKAKLKEKFSSNETTLSYFFNDFIYTHSINHLMYSEISSYMRVKCVC